MSTPFEEQIKTAHQSHEQRERIPEQFSERCMTALKLCLANPCPDTLKAGVLVVSEGAEPYWFSADSKGFTIGRSRTANLILSDSWVSARHCRLYMEDGEWIIDDLGSTNCTYINGEITMRKILCPGDIIDLGPYALVFSRQS